MAGGFKGGKKGLREICRKRWTNEDREGGEEGKVRVRGREGVEGREGVSGRKEDEKNVGASKQGMRCGDWGSEGEREVKKEGRERERREGESERGRDSERERERASKIRSD